MTPEVFILLIGFLALLLLNVPIAYAILLPTVLAMATLVSVPTGYVVAQRVATGIGSFPLLAIPFFILAGVLMGEGGIARRLMDFAALLVGSLRGGLAYVNTLTCMLFGAVSGSATAAVSSIGGAMIPEMEAKGFRKEFAIALTTASATTGLLIPPSNIMIVYAVVSGSVSVAGLFVAGVLPGMMMGLALMLTSFLILRRRPPATGSTRSAEETTTIRPTGSPLLIVLNAMPGLALIVIVLGGILGGIFSATEASAVAVAWAFLMAVVVYREVKLKDLPRVFHRAVVTNAVVLLLIGCSQAMSWVLSYERVPQMVSEAMLGLSANPIVLLLMINVLLLIVGTFMDMTPAVLIFTPIFLPVVTELGMDPVHFGIVLIMNLCIGLCTPPVGTCLFVGCGVGGSTIAKVSGPLLPFFFAMVLVLLATTYFAPLSMWLPTIFGL